MFLFTFAELSWSTCTSLEFKENLNEPKSECQNVYFYSSTYFGRNLKMSLVKCMSLALISMNKYLFAFVFRYYCDNVKWRSLGPAVSRNWSHKVDKLLENKAMKWGEGVILCSFSVPWPLFCFLYFTIFSLNFSLTFLLINMGEEKEGDICIESFIFGGSYANANWLLNRYMYGNVCIILYLCLLLFCELIC